MAASGTDGSWSLYEIEMFQSAFCNATTSPEYGVPFASSEKTGEEAPFVFDRDTKTRWTAGCAPCAPYDHAPQPTSGVTGASGSS